MISEQYLPGVGPFFQIAASREIWNEGAKKTFDSSNPIDPVIEVFEIVQRKFSSSKQ